MTERYSWQEAQENLQQLIAEARHGKTILILDKDVGAVQLVPVELIRKPRKAGSAAGKIKMAPDFDAPITDFEDED